MSILRKKTHYSFADILRGIQHAVDSAYDMVQARQVQNLSLMLQGNEGKPLTQKVQLGDREMDVPLIALVPQAHLAMEDVEIKFNAKVGDMVAGALKAANGNEISHADLKMSLEGVRSSDSDVMQITIRFKRQQPPEGISRLMDECNKEI